MAHIPVVAAHWLGEVPYLSAWERQKAHVAHLEAALPTSSPPHTLLLLEHPPTYTLGRRARLDNLLLDEAALRRAYITVHHVDRGGDITYHGPGQLVGYPILHLPSLQGRPEPDPARYLRDLEQVLIDSLAALAVEAWRLPGYTGVWVHMPDGEARKIAAIGVKVSGRGVTSHGFALNVQPDLSHFAGIIPCGIQEHGVTSLAQICGRTFPLPGLVSLILARFSDVFHVETCLVSAYNPTSGDETIAWPTLADSW